MGATATDITNLYHELLGRAPDASGMQHYSQGPYNDPNFIRSDLLNSGEYKQRVAQQQAWKEQDAQKAAADTKAKEDAANADRTNTQTEVNGLFGELGTADNQLHSPVDVYNAALDSLGMADARTRVQGLRESLLNSQNLLNNVAGDVQARTQDFNVSDNQRRHLTATESEPLTNQVDVMSRALTGAQGDYQDIINEGKTQADLTFQGDQAKRSAVMDRLKLKIDQAKNADDRSRWQAEYDRLLSQDTEAKRQFDVQTALKQQELAMQAAADARSAASAGSRSSGGGGSSGGGSSSGGGGSTASVNPMNEFLSYIAGQFKATGKNPSRQTQDAWANAWFTSKGISPAARQVYWDAYNKTYNRPANPYSDYLYSR
jgi:uncharacterized membrane protein YgcG